MEVPAGPARTPFDPGAAMGALFASRAAQIGWFLILALISRISVFGDSNYFNDEYFYWQVGLRMHDGARGGAWSHCGACLVLFFVCFGSGVCMAATNFGAMTCGCSWELFFWRITIF